MRYGFGAESLNAEVPMPSSIEPRQPQDCDSARAVLERHCTRLQNCKEWDNKTTM
jgi:hypothetical protein